MGAGLQIKLNKGENPILLQGKVWVNSSNGKQNKTKQPLVTSMKNSQVTGPVAKALQPSAGSVLATWEGAGDIERPVWGWGRALCAPPAE